VYFESVTFLVASKICLGPAVGIWAHGMPSPCGNDSGDKENVILAINSSLTSAHFEYACQCEYLLILLVMKQSHVCIDVVVLISLSFTFIGIRADFF